MCEEIAQYVDCENPLDLAPRPEPFWPAAVARALRKGAEEGSGLHNIAASLQMPSPEFAGLPITDLGVPVFSRMDEQQKASVLKILAVRT